MATLDSSNIIDGNTIEPTDILQLYDALTPGGGTTGAYNVTVSGSLVGNASTATSASYATTASYALNGGGGVTINNNTDNYLVTATGTANTLNGESALTFNGTTLTATSATRTIEFSAIGSGGAGLVLPTAAPSDPINGSVYWEDGSTTGRLRIWSELNATWLSVNLS